MKKNTLKYSFIVIIIIVVVCLLAYFMFFFGNKSLSSSTVLADLPMVYKNDHYNFSVNYPVGFATSTFSDSSGKGDVILIADFKSGDGLQIYVTPFAGQDDITAEFVKQNIPSLEIINPQPINIGESGKGVSFVDGTSTTANDQVWFSTNGYLYQVTSPFLFDSSLRKILKTWVFNKTK